MIQVQALTKLYGDFVAVDALSFEVQPGQVLGLVGPNGAGKTTTLRCLSGIIPATRGAIRICGHEIAADPIPAKRQLAFVNDEPRLFDYLTVEQHLSHLRERLLPLAERCGRVMREALASLETLRDRPSEAVERSRPIQVHFSFDGSGSR